MQENNQKNTSKPFFVNKGNSDEFNFLDFHIKASLLLIPVLLVIIGLYNFLVWLGLVS